jgi:hypothetical protein
LTSGWAASELFLHIGTWDKDAGTVKAYVLEIGQSGATKLKTNSGTYPTVGSAALADTHDLIIGRVAVASTRRWEGGHAYVMVLTEALDESQVLALGRDPWGPFRRARFLPTAVSGDLAAAGVTATVVVTANNGSAAKESPKAAAGVTATVAVAANDGSAAKESPKAAAGVTATVAVTAGTGTATAGGKAAAGVTATVAVTANDGTAAKSPPLSAAGITALVAVTGGTGTAAVGGDKLASGVTALVSALAGTGTAVATALSLGKLSMIVALKAPNVLSELKAARGTAEAKRGTIQAEVI